MLNYVNELEYYEVSNPLIKVFVNRKHKTPAIIIQSTEESADIRRECSVSTTFDSKEGTVKFKKTFLPDICDGRKSLILQHKKEGRKSIGSLHDDANKLKHFIISAPDAVIKPNNEYVRQPSNINFYLRKAKRSQIRKRTKSNETKPILYTPLFKDLSINKKWTDKLLTNLRSKSSTKQCCRNILTKSSIFQLKFL
jgi:hypothetical protein